MDNSLDRNQLWSPPLSRQFQLQGQSNFLLTAQHPPSSNTVTRSSQPGALPSSQIQLEEHQPSYPRTHLPFPQQQRYIPDHQIHPHTHLQRRPYPVPQLVSDPRDNTPGPSHTSAEDEADDFPNGTAADADSSISESHERDGRIPRQGEDDAPMDEEPLYVNAKQYNRILKRRVARARLEELHRLSRQRKPYLHESRHKHAMRRPRGPGGRFLTAEEIAAQQKAAESSDPSSFHPNPNPSAEERKALKASESAAVSNAERGSQVSFTPLNDTLASNSEANAGSSSNFLPYADAPSSTANGHDHSGDYSVASQPPASAQVQFSDLNAGHTSATGM
ncbi:hypothetical protein K439DRAFT_507472 [Ramaria rubella]|nr:hypothetical protein K439DRAFT_507472 [Ramaria rubella]